MKTKELTAAALFAALTAVCSQLAIPTPWDVPINLATMAVFLAVGTLGTKGATIAQLIFLALGAVGVPVFAGFRGGLSCLVGPTGGYLIGYVAAALVAGVLIARLPDRLWRMPLAFACGLAVCYAFGTAMFSIVTNTPFWSAVLLCVVPYLIGDALKIVVATLVCQRVRGVVAAA